jgi:Dolichyl-phosphate-mannose-protein mannosyltransferase
MLHGRRRAADRKQQSPWPSYQATLGVRPGDLGAEVATPASSSRMATLANEIAVFLIFFLLAVGLQWAGGAFSRDLGFHPDESAHYITGLMVRDYVAAGFPGNPIRFAEQFYTHFPKVAFGVWPPLFHILLGIWLLPAPQGLVDVFLLMALLMATAAYLLYRCVRPVAGRADGLIVGLLLVLLPLSQLMTSSVMADSLVMLTVLATSVATARWLKTGSNRDAVWIGICGGMALMTKGNGVAVVLAVPLAVLLTRRFTLLRKPGIYAAGLIGGGLGIAWQLESLRLNRQMSSFHPFTLAGVGVAAKSYGSFLFHALGGPLCALLILGLLACASPIRRRQGAWYLWASMAATAVAVLVFHIGIPLPPDGRYMLAAIAPMLVFLVPAGWKIERALPFARVQAPGRVPFVLPCVLAVFLLFFFHIPRIPQFGFHQVVTWLEGHPLPGGRYLIVSDADGEGAFIGDFASRTQRRIFGPRIMRASKFLFVSDWYRGAYRVAYDTPQQALADIEEMGISYVIVDTDSLGSLLPHWRQVYWMEHQSSGRLELVRQFPASPGGPARSIDVYQVAHYANPPVKRFAFQVIYTLGRSIEE